MRNFLLFTFVILLFSGNSYASLVVNPTRIEFYYEKDVDTTKTVRLSNNSNERVGYRISFQHLRMNEKGGYVEINKNKKDKIKENFVDDLIFFSPKRVTIEPRSSQVIRLLLKKSSNISRKEYRSHLLIAEEDLRDKKALPEEKNSKRISVSLKALLSTSIPVIVNVGEKKSKIEFGLVTIKENNLSIDLIRSGNSTIYGDLIINSANEKELSSIEGISVFYPYNKRKVNIKLKNKIDDNEIELVFYERNPTEDGSYEVNKSRPLARKIITLSN